MSCLAIQVPAVREMYINLCIKKKLFTIVWNGGKICNGQQVFIFHSFKLRASFRLPMFPFV